MDDGTDLELLERWGDGDGKAGEALARRYFVAVRAYFMTKVPFDYEDLVQETFSRLLRRRESFQGRSSFRVFLFGIAHMVLLEFFRRKRRNERFEPMESSAADLDGGRASSIMAEREHHRILFEALRSLVLREQELLELYYWQGLTAGEIAALHEAPEPTVRTRIRAALKRLGKAYFELSTTTHDRGADEDDFEGWMKEIQAGLGDLRVAAPPPA
ncbi:MAG: sigma-70 family RNA polymerase sigma factor [Myxococcales bacterium]|nr:sigma-70 family RNA polymerase sigma factor [Myxococcales bacterium]MCB9716789.1 sigma-70 family RNA polymerase sigma factor [Myxococcales bacterium]